MGLFKRKPKAIPTIPPVEPEPVEPLQPEVEVPQPVEQSQPTPVPQQVQEEVDDELTEERVKHILQLHEMRLAHLEASMYRIRGSI